MHNPTRHGDIAKQNGHRLRVMFVTTSYPTVENPRAHIFTHRAIKALDSEIESEVIEFVSWERGRRPLVSRREYDGIPVISFACPMLPWKKASHINAIIRIYFGRYVLQSQLKKADLIHAASLYPAGYIADRWAQSVGKPCTAHAIGSDVNFLLPQAQRSLFFRWQWHLDGIACESASMKRSVVLLFPRAQNVHVMYRGVNTDEFSSPDTRNYNNLPLRFLFLGGFHSWDEDHPFYNLKGGPILLQAWQQIEQLIGPDMLVIGGARNDTYRVHLESWRAALSRPDSVSFLPAVLDSVVGVIRESDVVVIPSLNEGLPGLAKEAQACGRPVLATDAGGIPEAVLDGKTGIIVPRGDVHALAEGFLWFHRNREKIATIGANARNHMMKTFSWKNFSLNMMDFFRAAIALHKAES
jgi:glycosyltransferase involved in cell wall biosynthesis